MQPRQALDQNQKILNELKKISLITLPCSNDISDADFNLTDEKKLQQHNLKPLQRIGLGNTTVKGRVLDLDKNAVTDQPILTVLLDKNNEVTVYYQNDWFVTEEDFYVHPLLALKYLEQVILKDYANLATKVVISKFFYDLLNTSQVLDANFITSLSSSEKEDFIKYCVAFINHYEIINYPLASLETLIKFILQNILELEWNQNENNSAFEKVLTELISLPISSLSSDIHLFIGQYLFNLALSGQSDQEFNLLLSLCFMSLTKPDYQMFYSALLAISNEKGLVENHENFWNGSKKAAVVNQILQLNYRYSHITDTSNLQYALGRLFYLLGEYLAAIKQLKEFCKKISKDYKDRADYPDSYFFAQLLLAEIYYKIDEVHYSEEMITQLFEEKFLFSQKFIDDLSEFIKDKKELSQAQFELGNFLNNANSLPWYRLSAQHGSIAAAVRVAKAEYEASPSKAELLRVLVRGVVSLNQEALSFLRMLEEKNDMEARLALVRIYYESPAHYDEQSAFELIKKAIQYSVQEPLQLLEEIASSELSKADSFSRQRIIAARIALGDLYQSHANIGIDLDKTNAAFTKAAEDNDGFALYRLAKFYEKTANFNRLDSAIIHYGAAISHGYQDALEDLEDLTFNPLYVQINYDLVVETLVNVFEKTRLVGVIELLEKLVKKKILKAQLAFGDLCEKGFIVGKGKAQAEESFSAAIQTDDLYAIFRYGALLCAKGKMHPDFKKGLAHIAEAAYRGYEPAIIYSADVLGKANDPKIELFVARLLQKSKFHQEVKLMWLRWASAGNSGEAALYLAKHFLLLYKENIQDADLSEAIQYFEIATKFFKENTVIFLKDHIFYDVDNVAILTDKILLAFFQNQTIRENALTLAEQYIILDRLLTADNAQLKNLVAAHKEKILDHFLGVSSEFACGLLLTHYELFGYESVSKRLFTESFSVLQKTLLFKSFIDRDGFLDYLFKYVDFKHLIPILENDLKFADRLFANYKQLFPKFLAVFREKMPSFLIAQPGKDGEDVANKLLVKWLDHNPFALQQLAFDHPHIAEHLFASSYERQISNEILWKIFQKHQKKSFTPVQIIKSLVLLAETLDINADIKIRNMGVFLEGLLQEDIQTAFYIFPSIFARYVSPEALKDLLNSKRLDLNEIATLLLKIEIGEQQQYFSSVLTQEFVLQLVMELFNAGKKYIEDAMSFVCSSYVAWLEFEFIIEYILPQLHVIDQTFLLVKLLASRKEAFFQELQAKFSSFTIYNNAILHVEAACLTLSSDLSQLLNPQLRLQIIDHYKDNPGFIHAITSSDDNHQEKPVLFKVFESAQRSPSVHALFAHKNIQAELLNRTEKTYKSVITKWFNVATKGLGSEQRNLLSSYYVEFKNIHTLSEMNSIVDRMLEEEILTERKAFTFSFYKSTMYSDLLKIKEMLTDDQPAFEFKNGKVCLHVEFRIS